MRKKSDKIVILLIIIFLFMICSWIIPGGNFLSGQYVKVDEMVRAGIYDFVLLIYSAFYYKIVDVLYILTVGGCYGVLLQTKSYRKLVDKTASLIEGKEPLAMMIITLVMGVYVSISNQLLSLFWLVPFIVSVFLRNGCKKLTAISAAFGGMFIGSLGLTVGSYGMGYLTEATGVPLDSLIVVKILIFLAAYLLFNIFAILYMNKYKKSEDATKYDILCSLPLDESNVKRRRRVKLWPIILVMSLTTILIMLAYISWTDSFYVQIFTDLHDKFKTALQIQGVPVLRTLLSTNFNAFGEFNDLLGALFFIISGTFIIALLDKISINDMVKNFGLGAKKISKVAFIYGFAFVILFMCNQYGWPATVINFLIGNGEFNIFIFVIAAIIAQFLCVDMEFFGYVYGPYLAVTYSADIGAVSLLWHLGGTIGLVVAPTSFLLLAALSYLDIPYVRWLSYIWKFLVTFIIAVFIIFAVVIYM